MQYTPLNSSVVRSVKERSSKSTTSSHCTPVSASACTLLALEQEHQTLLRALGQAQQRSSDVIQQMQQELHATRKAMQWWRTLALQNISSDVLETAIQNPHTQPPIWQGGVDAAQDCQNQCLSRQQLWRTTTAQPGNTWCLRDSTVCVLDEDSLPLPIATTADSN